MATQSGPALITDRNALGNWRAYHIFYHDDLNRLLRQLVLPLIASLLRLKVIDRFFFVRYSLGGRHVRLRWRVDGESAACFAETLLATEAKNFFALWPSSDSIPEHQIRNTNRLLLQVDPMLLPEDDSVYGDNSWIAYPIRFEIDRYGGPNRFSASLDLFALSSGAVLRLLAAHPEPGSTWVRPAILRLWLQLAWGFSADQHEFLVLANYASHLFTADCFEQCIVEADEVFAKRHVQLVHMVRHEVDSLIQSGSCPLAKGACWVAANADGLSMYAHRYLNISHIHMTANRLGLSNLEEVYLARILWLAADNLRCEEPVFWDRAWAAHTAFADQSNIQIIEQMITSELRTLAM